MAKPVRKWAKFKEGGLGGWSKGLSAAKRRAVLEKLVRKESYATVVRRLLQLKNVTKDSATVKAAASDMAYLKRKFRSVPGVHRRVC